MQELQWEKAWDSQLRTTDICAEILYDVKKNDKIRERITDRMIERENDSDPMIARMTTTDGKNNRMMESKNDIIERTTDRKNDRTIERTI